MRESLDRNWSVLSDVDTMADHTVAEELSNMSEKGLISSNELADMTARLSVHEELKETLGAPKVPEKSDSSPRSTAKKEGVAAKIAKSKAKTREMFERARAENYEEFSLPPSQHPASLFPEPVVLEDNGASSGSRSRRRTSKAQTKGRSSSHSKLGEGEAEQTQEDLNQSLEEQHKQNVKRENEKSTERRRRREAREIPQPPFDPTFAKSNDPVEVDPLLSKLDPAVLPSNIDKAIMAKEEGNDFFRNRNYDFALQQYTQAIQLCPRDEPLEEEGEGKEVSENDNHLATFLGNRAAAYFMLECWEECETDCNLSLHYKSGHVKVLMRRCMCLEKVERYEAALADAHAVQLKDPTFPRIGETVSRLQRAHERKMNELKDEALGK